MEKKRKRKKRKKSKKWLLYVGLVVLLLAVLGGGYALYAFKFKTYDVADDKVDELIEDNYVIVLPDGKEISVDKEGNLLEEVSGELVLHTGDASTQNDANPTPGSASTTNDNNNSPTEKPAASANETANPAEKPTVKSIKDKYRPSLNALEAQANSRISGLLANAKSEYSTKKANGESISIGYFYNKYMGAANGLEASTDAAFNSLIGIIEKDLVANGFDKSHAQSFREEYESMKQARRDSILSQVKDAL